jgi:hypothetical protein
MTNDKLCLICRSNGKLIKATCRDRIFRGNSDQGLDLCYIHSLELFKRGQTKFLFSYSSVLQGYNMMGGGSADVFDLKAA